MDPPGAGHRVHSQVWEKDFGSPSHPEISLTHRHHGDRIRGNPGSLISFPAQNRACPKETNFCIYDININTIRVQRLPSINQETRGTPQKEPTPDPGIQTQGSPDQRSAATQDPRKGNRHAPAHPKETRPERAKGQEHQPGAVESRSVCDPR